MLREYVFLETRRPRNFKINYFGSIDGVVNPSWEFPASKNGRVVKKGVPFEVYEYLKTGSTLKDGYLVLVGTKNEEDVNYIDYDKEELEGISKAIKTEKEMEEIFKKGNQLVLKKTLESLASGLDDEQKEEFKKYVFNTSISVGVDSSAKRQVIVEFCGLDYDEVGHLYDESDK